MCQISHPPSMTSLAACYVSTDLFSHCVTHGLMTDKEEVMGLLLGDVFVRFHSILRDCWYDAIRQRDISHCFSRFI